MKGFKAPLWGNTYREEGTWNRQKRGEDWSNIRTFHCTLCFRHGITDRMQHELEFKHDSHHKSLIERDFLGALVETIDCLWGDVVKSSPDNPTGI